MDNDIAMKSEYLKDILKKGNNDNEHVNKNPIKHDDITYLDIRIFFLINK